MSNQFLIDKEFSRKYEEYFASILEKEEYKTINDSGDAIILQNTCELNDGLRNDGGCDIFQKLTNEKGDVQGIRRIDVKCYRAPKFKKYFDGVFIETYLPLSNNPGWFYDESKNTTHYLFAINCSDKELKFDEAWLIDKNTLKWLVKKATKNDDIVEKKITSAHGFILPYGYLREEGEKIVD